MNYNNLCFKCFAEKPIADRPCHKCGYQNSSSALSVNCLKEGILLHNRYLVGIALGVGGFGITYKCFDTQVGGICAIKEYFPAKCAMRNGGDKNVIVSEQNLEKYNKIMKRFVEEAELLKTFHHRNIVGVIDSFFENNTAYYVMEYCDGIDLRKYTGDFKRKLGYEEGMNILYQVMNGLEYVHNKGVLHRDIAPDNIYITKNNTVKILDFGSARYEMDQMNRELSVIVKVGYAPVEQYGGRGKQGAYTDIYALGATFYHLFSSVIPMESTQRVAEDNMKPFSQLRPDLPDNLKYCIEKSMEITTANRISSISEMKRMLGLQPETVIKPKPASISNPQPIPIISKKTTTDIRERYRQSTGKNSSSFGLKRATSSSRVIAHIIDLLIYGLLYGVIAFFAAKSELAILLSWIMFPLVVVLINVISELLTTTTVGKGMFGLCVRNKNMGEPRAGQILIRNIIKLLNIFVLVFSQDDELLQDRCTDSMVYSKN